MDFIQWILFSTHFKNPTLEFGCNRKCGFWWRTCRAWKRLTMKHDCGWLLFCFGDGRAGLKTILKFKEKENENKFIKPSSRTFLTWKSLTTQLLGKILSSAGTRKSGIQIVNSQFSTLNPIELYCCDVDYVLYKDLVSYRSNAVPLSERWMASSNRHAWMFHILKWYSRRKRPPPFVGTESKRENKKFLDKYCGL